MYWFTQSHFLYTLFTEGENSKSGGWDIIHQGMQLQQPSPPSTTAPTSAKLKFAKNLYQILLDIYKVILAVSYDLLQNICVDVAFLPLDELYVTGEGAEK